MPVTNAYSRIQIALHWGVALLILMQFLLNESMSKAFGSWVETGSYTYSPLVGWHVFGGLAVFALVIWRLKLRFTLGVPPLPATDTPRQRMIANVTHWSLYGTMLLIPVSGILAWGFGIGAAGEAHEILTTVLLVLIVLHIGAALYHQFKLKDNLISRMRP
ncbi:cytochrome b [Paracoccaceae bacterium Fryx2]|nr:cytochrome b [Paracoccaceae bacterium Fryx2]